ncbi:MULTISPECIES: helix-turn-helix transcriptional regulator [unclassified Mesorhizobium]|uniref:helix-turn-helix domain-containing protein n=1 Tax=unclassified Mesorhizobium TaxID=325217 RepID=UPI001FDEF3D6|nr:MULTISPECIES: helix-turn-helix transcriptional regulator [unclassified Mesorhizobium]
MIEVNHNNGEKASNFSAEQCRGARAMLGWSQDDLARAANVARQTIADFERGARSPIANNILAIVNALERAGIEVLPNNGIVLRKSN